MYRALVILLYVSLCFGQKYWLVIVKC
ncbi:hypothetical protein F383_17804 [Gossypium arboreum]|uniref:Uncharacterized protein n=1 Tax=Gossypium arboreum TaxID=29729 RepID=A0A0B0NUC2_GOSAR|nr:hypothetical protein F383_17804 [Gossypium arboreum]